MGKSTCFPVSMLRASAFDTDLEYRIGKAIAAEAIAQGANFFGGVCINLVRNPRWGRTQESYGEDPHVLGEFGVALTKSIQEEGMIACPKHYALNSIEDLRFYVNVECDNRTLHEVYLPHFKKCVEAGALSVMGAYNRYDEFHCCGNKTVLTDLSNCSRDSSVWNCRLARARRWKSVSRRTISASGHLVAGYSMMPISYMWATTARKLCRARWM